MSTLRKIMLFCVVVLATTICMPVLGSTNASNIERSVEFGISGVSGVLYSDVQLDNSGCLVVYATLSDKPYTVQDQDDLKWMHEHRASVLITRIMEVYVNACEYYSEVKNLEIYLTDGRHYTCPRSRVDTAIKDGADTSCIRCGELDDLLQDVIAGRA